MQSIEALGLEKVLKEGLVSTDGATSRGAVTFWSLVLELLLLFREFCKVEFPPLMVFATAVKEK